MSFFGSTNGSLCASSAGALCLGCGDPIPSNFIGQYIVDGTCTDASPNITFATNPIGTGVVQAVRAFSTTSGLARIDLLDQLQPYTFTVESILGWVLISYLASSPPSNVASQLQTWLSSEFSIPIDSTSTPGTDSSIFIGQRTIAQNSGVCRSELRPFHAWKAVLTGGQISIQSIDAPRSITDPRTIVSPDSLEMQFFSGLGCVESLGNPSDYAITQTATASSGVFRFRVQGGQVTTSGVINKTVEPIWQYPTTPVGQPLWGPTTTGGCEYVIPISAGGSQGRFAQTDPRVQGLSPESNFPGGCCG